MSPVPIPMPFPRVAAPLLLWLAACTGDTVSLPSSNPVPVVEQLTPSTVEQYTQPATVTVLGRRFVNSSVVRVNGEPRATRYVSATELRVTLDPLDVLTTGGRGVSVRNPSPGGGESNTMPVSVVAVTYPQAVLSSVTPTEIVAGSPATVVTVRGSGFSSRTVVSVEYTARSGITVVSPTELRFTLDTAELATGASLRISLSNPGTAPSAVFTVRVVHPAPAITALPDGTVIAGQTTYSLRVAGSGFVPGSVVQVDGAPRQTTVVSSTLLRAALTEHDLRGAGTRMITVFTPLPGGGTSNALALTLVNGTPTLALLPSQGGHAGRGGFSLTVHGTGFVDGSVVQWDGAALPTQFVAANRLMAEVSPNDLAVARVVNLSVRNPTPGGGTSASVPFTVRAVPAAVASSVRSLELGARDLAVDDARSRLLVSVAATASADANHVVTVDPLTAVVTGRVFVGSNPGHLARSDDGQWLYVGLDGSSAVRRVDLATLSAGLQWSLPQGLIAGGLQVLPGQPRSVAVVRVNPELSPPLDGVTVYDDGIARAGSSPAHTGANRLASTGARDTLYGFNNAHTGFEFFTLTVDSRGIRHVRETSGVIGGFDTRIMGAAGRVYATDGAVVDAERHVRVGRLPVADPWMAPLVAVAVDPMLGRAFGLTASGITVYDLNSFQLLGTVAVPGLTLGRVAYVDPRLVRWGREGLAFVSQGVVYMVQSPMFGP